jgi:hypothetical protein
MLPTKADPFCKVLLLPGGPRCSDSSTFHLSGSEDVSHAHHVAIATTGLQCPPSVVLHPTARAVATALHGPQAMCFTFDAQLALPAELAATMKACRLALFVAQHAYSSFCNKAWAV